jgi:hypothetical protein
MKALGIAKGGEYRRQKPGEKALACPPAGMLEPLLTISLRIINALLRGA